MGANCCLIGKNEQETIKNYAEWSIGWLNTVSYDLMLTMQKLKTIYNGQHLNQSDSVEYNALRELIGSLYDQLKQKYYDNECENIKYDDLSFILKNIHNSTIKMKGELNNNKPIEIKKNTLLIERVTGKSYKINIPGSYGYYLRYSNASSSRNESIFYEIDKYIHDYFGDVENPFETEFSLVFNDVDVVKYLNGCVLKDVIYSSKNPIFKKLDSICRNVDNSVRVHCRVSILENLRINYPKIKFEYNENTTKEFILNENNCLKNKTVKLMD